MHGLRSCVQLPACPQVICPDPWKEGANNTNQSGGRKINENKALSKGKRYTPYGKSSAAPSKCKVRGRCVRACGLRGRAAGDLLPRWRPRLPA